MVAFVRCGGRKLRIERERFLGFDGLLVTVPEKRALKRTQRAAKRLRRMGVGSFVRSDSFPHAAELEKAGLSAPSPVALYRELAAEITVMALERAQADPVYAAVCGSEMTRELRRAAIVLAGRARYLLIDCENAEILAQELKSVLGVPCVAMPTRAQLDRAELTLCFAPVDEPKGIVAALCETPERFAPEGGVVGAELSLGSDSDELPAEFDKNLALAALYSDGAFGINELKVANLLHLTGEAKESIMH